MTTSDDHKPNRVLQTTKPAPRRSVSARDYTMPKPYRKPVFSDDMRALTRQQVLLLGGATALIAGLIFTLALLARRQPDPAPLAEVVEPAAELLPVKAVRSTPKRRVAVKVPPARPGQGALYAAGADSGHVPAEPRPPFKLLIPASPHSPPATSAPAAPVAPPDPDVDLITVILTLFPPAAAERTPGPPPCAAPAEKGDGCEPLQAMQR